MGWGRVGRTLEKRRRWWHDNIPRANSHETRPSLFALVRCQPRKQCGPRTEAEESNGAGILNTLEYLPSVTSTTSKQKGIPSALVHVQPRDRLFFDRSVALSSPLSRSLFAWLAMSSRYVKKNLIPWGGAQSWCEDRFVDLNLRKQRILKIVSWKQKIYHLIIALICWLNLSKFGQKLVMCIIKWVCWTREKRIIVWTISNERFGFVEKSDLVCDIVWGRLKLSLETQRVAQIY